MSTTSSSSQDAVLPLSLAPQIASSHISPVSGPSPTTKAIELSQARHRINILNSVSSSSSPIIAPGSRVLELGCGQGTCTAVLATAVAASGRVDTVDPAPLSYGAPYTLGQAQDWLSKGELGGRITWHQADPVKFLTEGEGRGGRWDVAVLVHCIWYFRSDEELGRLLAALKGRVSRVLVAEYAMHATEKGAVPHVLASIARGTLEAHRENSSENIQTLVSPDMIKEVVEGLGWRVEREGVVVPEEELDDGRWEVGGVLAGGFMDEVDKIGDGKVRMMLRSARDAVKAAVDGVGGLKRVRTMDVWVATLVEK